MFRMPEPAECKHILLYRFNRKIDSPAILKKIIPMNRYRLPVIACVQRYGMIVRLNIGIFVIALYAETQVKPVIVSAVILIISPIIELDLGAIREI